jgi:murein endopeptidase
MQATEHRSHADALQADIYRRMTPARRLELAIAMQHQARELMDAGLRQTHPGLTDGERRREVARRILHART